MKFPLTCFCCDSKEAMESSGENGFDRVKRMYRLDSYGLLSPEMHYLIQNASAMYLMSGVMGAALSMGKAKENYLRQNVASTFESQHLARRKLTDTMSLSGVRGAIKYSVKYGTFSSMYLLSTMTVANFNNKITVWEHIGTGVLLGAITRINFGLKGMVAAATLGGVLGSFFGGILVVYMKLNNCTIADLRKLQSQNYYEGKKRYSAPE